MRTKKIFQKNLKNLKSSIIKIGDLVKKRELNRALKLAKRLIPSNPNSEVLSNTLSIVYRRKGGDTRGGEVYAFIYRIYECMDIDGEILKPHLPFPCILSKSTPHALIPHGLTNPGSAVMESDVNL